MKQHIKDLIEIYLEIVNSPRNQKNKKYWDKVYEWNRDMWRGIPKAGKSVPFTIAPDNSLWSHILKIDLRDYYINPETYLETQLAMKIYHYNNFNDNTYFTDELFIWFGVITELSFFNAKVKFYTNKEGWIEGNVVNNYDDLNCLEIPEFYKSGLMPKIHQYYEVLNEYSDGKLKVMFPEWVRGPFCIAAHLRGMENILMDTIINPDFIHRFMRFITDANKKWNEDRNNFLKTEINTCKLFNDEVGSPTISPKIYKEFIFPYEKELSDYYGEVAYWHSCGNTTDFFEQINKLTNLRMFHCGPWTSYEKASRIIDKNTSLDICLNPNKDVLEADEQQMIDKLKDIINTCKASSYFVRADGFMLEGNLDVLLKKISLWNQLAIKLLNEQYEQITRNCR